MPVGQTKEINRFLGHQAGTDAAAEAVTR